MEKILDFYKQTSPYTDLGLYKEFAINLPNEVKELAKLQRMQIIHPTIIWNNLQDGWWDDLNKVPKTSIIYEDDIFPTACSMLAELLRRDKNGNILDLLLNSNTVNMENYPLQGYVYPLKRIIKILGYND